MGARLRVHWERSWLGRIRRCQKVCYPDRDVAAAALELRQEAGSGVRRCYFCWQCRAWHLTSQELRG